MTLRAFAALCALALAPSARAGIVLEMRTGGEGERPSRMFIDGNRLRIEQDGADGQPKALMIFDASTRTMTNVDADERTYHQVTADDLRRMTAEAKAKAREGLAQARAQLEQLPPEQRKQVEAALAQAEAQPGPSARKPPRRLQLRFEKTGRSGSAAGHACEWYRQFDGDEAEGEGCFTPLARLGLKVDDFKVFQALLDVLDPGGAAGGGELDFAKVLAQAPGFPVIAAETEEGKRVETMRVVRIAREPIAASTFAPPAGYRRVPGPGTGAPPGKGGED